MGIFDFITDFFEERQSTKEAETAIADAKKSAKREDYNQASMKVFYALETLGETFADFKREDHITAREYVKQIANESPLTEEEMEQIVINFEVAKYSEGSVSMEDYSTGEQALEAVAAKFKSGQAEPKKKKRKPRRKPRRGGKTGRARRRRKRK